MSYKNIIQRLLYCCTLFFLLAITATVSSAQTPISISSPQGNTVCVGTVASYSIAPTPNVNYTWTTSIEGNISGSNTGSSVSAEWISSGTGAISVIGKDANNVTVETGTYPLTILAPPSPNLEWDVRVGCQVIEEGYEELTEGIDDGPCVRVCENNIVEYWITSPTGGPVSFAVTGGSIIAQSGNSCTVQWGTAGFGSISVTEAYPSPLTACAGTTTMCIEIIHSPEASFIAIGSDPSPGAVISACQNSPVYFQDLSNAGSGSPIVSRYWDFGDGTFSSVTDPVHSYANAGSYTVTLTVTNECNCTSTYERLVEVSPNDEPLIIECPSVVCEGATATYVLNGPDMGLILDCLSSGAAQWQVIGGTIVNPIPADQFYLEVVWDNVGPDGFGYVIFKPDPDCGLCPAPTVVKVPVILTSGIIEGPTFICPDQRQYRYTLPQWPATLFDWTIATSTGASLIHNDQSNEIILQTANPGLVTITGTYQNTLIGCSGSATIQVQVTNSINVTGPVEVCEGQAAAYSLPAGLLGNWKVTGPGGFLFTATNVNSISPTFLNSGSYVLNVEGQFCFEGPLLIAVQPLPPPADFIEGEDTICTNIPYVFTAGNALPGAIFEWSVTGGIAIGQSGNQCTFIFTGAGPYSLQVVRRHIQNPNCPSVAVTKTLHPLTVDVDIVGTNTVCPNTTTDYNATFANGETYEWSIANTLLGSIISGNGTPNISILWNNGSAPANTSIKLIMRKCNQEYVRYFPVSISPLPVLTLTPDQDTICDESPLTIAVGGYTGTVDWSYNNGGSYTGSPDFNGVINANVAGNTIYTFTATVNNPYGCPGSISEWADIVILPKPAISLSPNGTIEVCPPDPISIPVTATLQSGYQPTAQLEWYHNSTLFNTCNPVTPGCPNYTITGYGSYYVEAVGNNGCRTQSETITVSHECPDICTLVPDPTLTITHTTNHCGEYIFTGSHSGSPIGTGWEYSANLTQTGGSGSTIHLQAGIAGAYAVAYWADYLDANGDTCRKLITEQFVVSLIPDIRYSVLCNGTGTGYDLSIHDYSNLYPGTVITGYTYYINGIAVAGPMAASTYTTALAGNANYDLQIMVNYAYGGASHSCMSNVLPVVLPALPVADFEINAPAQVCMEYPVEFVNLSQPATGVTYLWDFGDGTFSTVKNPHRAYSILLDKDVTLTVTDEFGCNNSANKSIEIKPNELGGSLVTIPSSGIVCPNTLVILDFNSTGTMIPNSYNWMEGMTNFMNTYYEPISVNQSGNYWLRVNGEYLCYKDIPAVDVKVISVPEVQIVGDHYYCKDENIKLYGYAGSNVTYQWYLNSSALAGYTNAFLDYPSTSLAAGNYNFSLEITYLDPGTSISCSKMSNPYVVTITEPPAPPSVSFDMIDCEQYLIKLQATHPEPGNFTWSNGGFGSCIQVTEGGPYKVWFDNGLGCLSSATIQVPRNPEDYLWVFPTGCYAFCTQEMPKTIHGPIIPFTYWAWIKDGSPDLNSNGYVDPYTIHHSGIYNLQLQNDYCEKTSGDLDLSIKDCGDCKLRFRMDIRCIKSDDGCIFQVIVTVFNPTPYNINVNLSTTAGYFVPGSITLAPGNNVLGLQFVPGPGYVDGFYFVTYSSSYYDVDAKKMVYCMFTDKANFPKNCCQSADRPASSQNDVVGGTLLTLLPNPAQNSVRLRYAFEKEANDMRVELFDMHGNRLKAVQTEASEGVLEWEMSPYAAGVYLVVLRQDGKIIRQAKLSLTK